MILWQEKAKSPAFWESVREAEVYAPLRGELAQMWERDCITDIPASKFTLFHRYNEDGDRNAYEKPYFDRRRSLNASALLTLIYPEEPKYMTRLVDTVWAILDEYTWVLPAHIGNFRDNVVEFIDLFSAETAFALSEIDYLLADRLPPLIRSRIRAEIDRRVVQAYIHSEQKPFWWEKGTNNWAAVCAGSVGITLLYQRPDLFDALLPRLEATMECFLAGFPEDGICLEGFGYWHYGFGFFTAFADMLRTYTGGEKDYFARPKVRQIARFVERMYLSEKTTVSFSDGGASGRYHIGVLHYLKTEYPEEIHLLPRDFSYTSDGCGRWCFHSRAFFWLDASLADGEAAPSAYTDYAPDSQWLIVKREKFGFAAKGGTNAEPHNHNDLGSFIVAALGRQILTDPGAGVYNKAYFSGKRYESFFASSRGHSVPIVGGQYQSAGAEHRATADYADGVLTLEIGGGYDVPALASLRRTFTVAEDGVTVEDRYTWEGDAAAVVERFVLTEAPTLTPEGVEVGGLVLRATEGITPTVSEVPRGRQVLYLLDYAVPDGVGVFTLRVTV